MTAQLFYGLIHAPLAIAVDGLLPMSELLWALTLFLHYHLGMRQLKASGNLGFIDISQRPQPGSICFPWQVSPTPACLPGCCPCTQPVALTAALLWGRHSTFYGNSSPSREMEVDVGSGGEGLHPGVRSCLLLVSCFQCFFLGRAQGGHEAAPGPGNQTGLLSLSSQPRMEPACGGAQESPSWPPRAEYVGHSLAGPAAAPWGHHRLPRLLCECLDRESWQERDRKQIEVICPCSVPTCTLSSLDMSYLS